MRRTDFSSPCRRWRRSIRQHTQSSMRQHASAYGSITSAYVGIRRHTSAYLATQHLPSLPRNPHHFFEVCLLSSKILQMGYCVPRQHTSEYVSIRQHSSAYVSMCQHTSAHVSIPVSHVSFCRCQCSSRWDVCSCSIRQHTSAYVSIRQHKSAYVSILQHTSAHRTPLDGRCAAANLARVSAHLRNCQRMLLFLL
jgi:hypothetical protein